MSRRIPAALIVGWLASLGAAAAAGVEIRAVPPQDAEPGRVLVRLVRTVSSSGEAAPAPLKAELEVPGSLRLDLEHGSVWHLSTTSDYFWAGPEVISPAAEAQVVLLKLWRTTRVRGRLDVGRGAVLPEEVSLRFESPPDSEEQILRATETCAVEDGRYECRMPAARLDLRLRARGFVSHYFWDVALEPESAHELGVAKLERGASIVGWIRLPDAKVSFEDVQVELSREISSAELDAKSAGRRPSLALTAPVNERGFFELAGVAEGLYAVTAVHPDFAPARYSPIQVLRDAESELPTLELEQAVALRVTLQPAAAPSEARWLIELLRRGEAPGHFEELSGGAAGADGVWTRAGLPPDDYVLRVREGAEAAWFSEELVLPPGAGQVSLEILLPVETLEGRVLLGSEPVAANLFFGGYHGAVRIPAASDPEGRFEVRVPERDRWTVDVYFEGRNGGQRFQDVVPEPAGRSGRRWLELVVPDTLVQGRVVDTAGEPVEDARVRISGAAGGMTERSDPDGSFEIRGLEPGDYWLEAKTLRPERRSEMLDVTLDKEEGVEPFELVVKPLRRLAGQVIGPSGQPVIGAKVLALVEQTAAGRISSEVPDAVTDLGGTFSLELPDRASGVQLTVFPPGFAVRQLGVDARSSEPVVLRVEPHGGTLRIHHDEQTNPALLRIFHASLLPYHSFLINWAELHGEANATRGVLSVPSVEPGRYVACRDLGYDVLMTGVLAPWPDRRCAEGFLAPFGELDLRIPPG